MVRKYDPEPPSKRMLHETWYIPWTNEVNRFQWAQSVGIFPKKKSLKTQPFRFGVWGPRNLKSDRQQELEGLDPLVLSILHTLYYIIHTSIYSRDGEKPRNIRFSWAIEARRSRLQFAFSGIFPDQSLSPENMSCQDLGQPAWNFTCLWKGDQKCLVCSLNLMYLSLKMF